jgi:hypothetical protein
MDIVLRDRLAAVRLDWNPFARGQQPAIDDRVDVFVQERHLPVAEQVVGPFEVEAEGLIIAAAVVESPGAAWRTTGGDLVVVNDPQQPVAKLGLGALIARPGYPLPQSGSTHRQALRKVEAGGSRSKPPALAGPWRASKLNGSGSTNNCLAGDFASEWRESPRLSSQSSKMCKPKRAP